MSTQPADQQAQPAVPYIGSRISLISKSDIRYEGTLYTINPKESTVSLSNVRMFGTEGRRGGSSEQEIAPRQEIYEYIIFRGSDIKDLTVCEPPPVPQAPFLNQPQAPQAAVADGSASQKSIPSSSPAASSSSTSGVQAQQMPGSFNPYAAPGAFNPYAAPGAPGSSPYAFNPYHQGLYPPYGPPPMGPPMAHPLFGVAPPPPHAQFGPPMGMGFSSPTRPQAQQQQQQQMAAPPPQSLQRGAVTAAPPTQPQVQQPQIGKPPQQAQASPPAQQPVQPAVSQAQQRVPSPTTLAPSAPVTTPSAAPSSVVKKPEAEPAATTATSTPTATSAPTAVTVTPPTTAAAPTVVAPTAAPTPTSALAEPEKEVPSAQPQIRSQQQEQMAPTTDEQQQQHYHNDGTAQRRRGSGHRYQHSWRGGRGGGRSSTSAGAFGTAQFEGDFDFESANARFSKEKLLEEVTKENSDKAALPIGPTYSKTTSFFDNISCESLERKQDHHETNRPNRHLDSETFGRTHIARYRGGRGGHRGGRGGSGMDHGSYQQQSRGPQYQPQQQRQHQQPQHQYRSRGGRYNYNSSYNGVKEPAPAVKATSD